MPAPVPRAETALFGLLERPKVRLGLQAAGARAASRRGEVSVPDKNPTRSGDVESPKPDDIPHRKRGIGPFRQNEEGTTKTEVPGRPSPSPRSLERRSCAAGPRFMGKF